MHFLKVTLRVVKCVIIKDTPPNNFSPMIALRSMKHSVLDNYTLVLILIVSNPLIIRKAKLILIPLLDKLKTHDISLKMLKMVSRGQGGFLRLHEVHRLDDQGEQGVGN